MCCSVDFDDLLMDIYILIYLRLLQKNSRLLFLFNILPRLHPSANFFSMGDEMSKTTMPTPQDALKGKS